MMVALIQHFELWGGGGNNKKELEKFQNLQVGNLKV